MAAEKRRPVGGVDYPRTQGEFDEWFSSEGACLVYLRRVRWPGGFQCPACLGTKGWATSRETIRCAACQRQTSPTAGTILEGTRKPLRTWFQAMWYVTGQKHGVSALGLQRVLGLGSYQTAWAWLHKLRRAMVRPGRHRLHGTVEVDESYVGGPETGMSGRGTRKKAIVAVAAEVRGPRIGRVRLQRIQDVSSRSLEAFIQASVEPGSLLRTDDWAGYRGVEKLGYRRQATSIQASGRTCHEVLPHVHRVVSLMKRWILGTHHGGVQARHLDYYLDEFTFRFNRRTSRARGMLFYRLLQQALAVDPIPYRRLVGGAGSSTPNT